MMKDGIYKTSASVSSPVAIPLSDPKIKFNDVFKIDKPYAANGMGTSVAVQHEDDEPQNRFFVQNYDGMQADLRWGVYSPRKKDTTSSQVAIINNPYIKEIVVTKNRCSLNEVDNPNKIIGSPVETFSGINGGEFSIQLERNIDRYLNFSISIEDVFGNKDTGNLILRNDPAEAKINNIHTSGGFVYVDYTGSEDLLGMNLYGFTGSNIYGKLADTQDFKDSHKVLTINESNSGKIPLYPKKRFHILACPFDSAGESSATQLREGIAVESPSGFFFTPSFSGININKTYGGDKYEIQYNYDWVDNPFVQIKYKLVPTGELKNAVSGYNGAIAYDCGFIKDSIASDSLDSTKFVFDNKMTWQNETKTGTTIEVDGEVFGSGAGSKWSEESPKYSGSNGIYRYAYIDSDSCKITCATASEVKSGLCPVQGTFSLPINEPNSDEISFRNGENFSQQYERAATYLKEVNEMPAVILNKAQLNKIKEFPGVKGWIGLRREDVGCLESLFSTNIQNNIFFNEVDFGSPEGTTGYLDKDGERRYFLKNNIGDSWAWVNSSGDHVYKYAGNSGYHDMNTLVNAQAEYVGENGITLSEDTQRLDFPRPSLTNLRKSSDGSTSLSLGYNLKGSSYTGNIVHPEINKINFHTGTDSLYTPDESNLFNSFIAKEPHEIEAIQIGVSIDLSGANLDNIKIVPWDNLGSGVVADLNQEFGTFNLYSKSQIIEHSLDGNYTSGGTDVSVYFPIRTKSPRVTFGISTKNTTDAPVFMNTMLVGEPEETHANFILSQPPPNTGYCLTLNILAGDNANY